MRDAIPELDLDARIGVNTGEVVTGTAERLATGDPEANQSRPPSGTGSACTFT
jgi:class 3 adenylate cyclase